MQNIDIYTSAINDFIEIIKKHFMENVTATQCMQIFLNNKIDEAAAKKHVNQFK